MSTPRAFALLVFVALGSMAFAACSSSDPPTADGAGGAQLVGKAGAAGVGGTGVGGAGGKSGNAGKAGCGVCSPGATQACTGPGACKGGQQCKDDGCGWNTCDCGAAGSSAGKSGASGAGGGPVGTGGMGASGATAGTGGAAMGGTTSAGGAAVGTGGAPGAGGSPPGTGGSVAGPGGMSPGAGGSAALACPNAGGGPHLGAAGSAGMAGTTLDLHQVTLFDNPTNIADWPITTSITLVEFGNDLHVEFDKQDGPNRWPDIVPPGWTGPLQYTLGMAEYVNGQWVGSAAIEYWYGLAASGGNVAKNYQVACNWYYDGRWGALEKRQPATGEIIGIFVVAGNLRGVKDGSQSPVMERSNVVLMPMPDVGGAKYTFLRGRTPMTAGWNFERRRDACARFVVGVSLLVKGLADRDTSLEAVRSRMGLSPEEALFAARRLHEERLLVFGGGPVRSSEQGIARARTLLDTVRANARRFDDVVQTLRAGGTPLALLAAVLRADGGTLACEPPEGEPDASYRISIVDGDVALERGRADGTFERAMID